MATFYSGQTDYIEKLNELASLSDLLTIPSNIEAAEVAADAATAAAAAAALSAAAANTEANNALSFANSAQDWAIKVDAPVSAGEYSSKYWAQVASATVGGGIIYKGTWSAVGGTYPTSPSTGWLYKISAAGTISGTVYAINDSIIYNGTVWSKIASTDSVTSVAGKTGTVTLVKADVGLSNVDNTSDLAKPVSTATSAALDLKAPVATTVTAVTGTGPIVSSGGLTPAISIPAASASVNGYMSSTYAAKLDSVALNATANLGTVTGVTATAPIASTGGTAPVISMPAATSINPGYMTAAQALKLDNIAEGATASGGSVSSVTGTGTVSGLTLTGTVTSAGSLTLGGTLLVAASNFGSQSANTFLAAPNGSAGTPTFRSIIAADIPTLNQNTSGSAATLTTARSINGVNFNGSANITVPSLYDANYRRITNPGGAEYVTTTASVTGAIAITLPVGMTGTMLSFSVKVYNYVTNESFEVRCGGYNFGTGNTWVNAPFAYIVGNPGVDRRFTVRFGYTSGLKAVVYIGELASVWSRPQVFVTDVQLGFGGTSATWVTGWNIDFVTAAFENVTATISTSQVGYPSSGNLTGPITSVGLATSVASQTGTGSTFVMNTSPTLVTPIIGAATGTSLSTTGSVTASALIPSSATVPANGLYLPAANTVALATGTTERVRIDSAGNMLLGTSTTVSVASSVAARLQIASIASTIHQSLTNYSVSTDGGILSFGKSRGTSVGSFTIVASGDTLGEIRFAGADGTDLQTNGAIIRAQVDGTPGVDDMPSRLVFLTTPDNSASPAERMRIDSVGSVGIGVTPSVGRSLTVGKAITGATSAFGTVSNGTIQSDVTVSYTNFVSAINTQAATFTVPAVIGFSAQQNALGANSVITSQYGFYASNTLTGAGSNYGFYGDIPAAAGRWNLYMAGTAQNAIAGNVRIGSTTAPTVALDVTGNILASGTITSGGNATFGNTLTVGASINGNTGVELGYTGGVATTTYIDFHSGATAVDYDSRIAATGGNGSTGQGALTFTAANSNFQGNLGVYKSSGIPKFNVISEQAAGFAPAQLQLWRYGAAAAATPDAQTLGELRFDALTTGAAYSNVGMISVISGTNTATGTPGSMFFATSDGTTTSAATRMSIDASGNVGIGTTTPSARLEIGRLGGDQVIPNLNAITAVLVTAGGGTTASGSAITLAGGNASFTGVFFGDVDDGSMGALLYDNTTNSIQFRVNGVTERMRIDSAGNVGIGVVPSAWTGGGNIQVAGNIAFSGGFTLASNAYFGSGSVFRYINTGVATLYQQTSGQHIWFYAASGTAGNTLSGNTQAMILDATGNLGVGGTASGGRRIHAKDTNCAITSEGTGGYGSFYATSSGTSSSHYFFGTAGVETGRISTQSDNVMTFSNTSSATTRMWIGATGNVGIGAVSAGQLFEVTKNQNAATVIAIRNTDAGTSASSILQLTGGTKYANFTLAPNNGNYLAIQGAGGIVIKYEDFDTHNWRNNAGASNLTLDSTGNLTATNAIFARSTIQARTTTTTHGFVGIQPGNATNSGYIEFWSHTGGNRQGYIGFCSTNAATNEGTIPYVASVHAFSGALTINTNGSGGSIHITDTGAAGANIRLTGNGATTPNKYIRAAGGVFQILNNAYTTALLELSDAGALSVTGSLATIGLDGTAAQITLSRNGYNYITAAAASATLQIQASGASGTLTFATNGAERMRIGPNGNVGIGSSNNSDTLLLLSKSISGISDATATAVDVTLQTSVTGSWRSFKSLVSTINSTFTIGEITHYLAGNPTIGAGSTITNNYGFVADSTIAGSTFTAGFFGNISAGTEKYNLYMAGTASNYLEGDLYTNGRLSCVNTLGYSTTAGGTVTQTTSRTTAVTLDKVTGAITLFSAAGSATAASFTVNNNKVAATDTIILSVKSSTNTYAAVVTAVAAGSFRITFWSLSGTSTDSPVINFALIVGQTS